MLRYPAKSETALARYALYRSYVLLAAPPIEPISEHIPDQFHSGNHSGYVGRLMSPLLYH